jgi:hypothetical protein
MAAPLQLQNFRMAEWQDLEIHPAILQFCHPAISNDRS